MRSFHTKESSIIRNFRSFCRERKLAKHRDSIRKNSSWFHRISSWKNGSVCSRPILKVHGNNRIPRAGRLVKFERNRGMHGPFSAALRYSRYEVDERFSIRPIFQGVPMLANTPVPASLDTLRHDKNFTTTVAISNDFTVRQGVAQEFPSLSFFFSYATSSTNSFNPLTYLVERRKRSRKLRCSKASCAPHQSLNRKRSRLVCRPIWRSSTFFLSYPPHRRITTRFSTWPRFPPRWKVAHHCS